jgi:hypothetical protein
MHSCGNLSVDVNGAKNAGWSPPLAANPLKQMRGTGKWGVWTDFQAFWKD